MRKIIFFLLFIIISSISVHAQEADSAFASVRYSFTHVMDTTQRDNPLKENMILFLGKNMSNYTSWDRIDRAAKAKASGNNGQIGSLGNVTSVTSDVKGGDASNIKSMSVSNGVATITGNNGNVTVMNFSAQFAANNSYYKDQSASKLDYISFTGGKLFAIEEKTPAIEWNITQETKDILGLSCQKAIGDFKGRTYEAWFSTQLPYSNGPWKLGGLPGLIVEAYDTKKEVMFMFTSFENANGAQTAIELPKDIIKTTPKEFKQYQEALQKDRQAMMGSSSGGNITVTNIRVGGAISGGTFVGTDGSGKPVKPRMMNNPIEKVSN